MTCVVVGREICVVTDLPGVAMISMTCSCGGDFWVRDRLAGQTTQCPTCGTTLAIPPMSSIEARLTPARCACGEVFWSASWRPGRRTKCPVCGRAVGGPAPTTSATVSSTTPPTSSGETLPLAPKPPVSAVIPPASTATPRDPLRSGWPALVGTLVGLAVVLVFGMMIWSGVTTPEPNPSDDVPSTGITRGDSLPGAAGTTTSTTAPDTTPASASQVTPPTAVAPPLTNLPEAFRTARLRLLIPAYFYPAGPGMEHWNRLMAAAGRVPIGAIVNPSSGPGDEPNPEYAALLTRTDRAGLLTVGYVNTNYAERPISQVKDDIDRWVRFYPEIDGIFLDAQASSEAHVDYYIDLCAYVRSKINPALVVSNAGTRCDPAYFLRPTADVIILFENSQGFDAFRLPSSLAGYDPLRFAAMPYAIPSASEMRERIQQSVLKGIGTLYLTDAGQADAPQSAANPWERLPTYWDDEVEAISNVNQGRSP